MAENILDILNELDDVALTPEVAEPAEEEIESKALTHVEQARSVAICDQGTYDGAVEILLANKALQSEVVEHHKPIKQATWNSWQVAIAQEKKILEPLQQAEKILKLAVGKWDVEQTRLLEERKRVEREAAEVERAREVQQEVREAEAAGASPVEVQAIVEQPRPAPRPIVAPTYTKSKAVPVTTTYGCDVTDIKALCKAVADGTTSTELVMGLEKDKDTGVISSPALETMAKALRETFAVAGCKLVTGSRVSARTKGRK